MEMLNTENALYGFYGTMANDACADAAWNEAMRQVGEATGAGPEAVRAFLDSCWGRHFADEVHCKLGRGLAGAITAAVLRWQEWRISRATHRELGIPAGLPYLTGFVHHAAIDAGVE